MKWLSEQFYTDYVHVFMYSYSEVAEAENTMSVTWASVYV